MEQSTRVLWFLLVQIYCSLVVQALGHSVNVDISLYIQTSSDGEGYHVQYGTVKDDIPRLYYNSRNLNVFLIPDLNGALDELVGPLVDTEDANVFSFYYEDPQDVQSMSDADKMTVISKGAEQMSKFIVQLNKNLGMDLDNVELIGYGGGAHIAGIIGNNLESKVKSIIALDPSYPVHDIKDKKHVLDPTDAKNVHVIHTSGATIGHFSNLGTADFYPNGGMSQPGCDRDKSGVCSHQKAIDYYIASLKKGYVFVCFKCTSYKYVKNLELEKCHEYGLMGRLLPDDRVSGTHYCITRFRPPYLYSIVPDPNEAIDVSVSTEAVPLPELLSTVPYPIESQSTSADVTVSNKPGTIPVVELTATPTTPKTLEPNNVTRITNVYILKDLAAQLENELQSSIDSVKLGEIKNSEYDRKGISALADSVESYISRDFRRLSRHIPGNNLEQIIADVQAITWDLEYPLELARSRIALGPNLLEQFKDRLSKLQNNIRRALEHLKQVIKQPDSNIGEIETTFGLIKDLATRLNPDQLEALDEYDLRQLIHAVQNYLQLIAKQISSSRIEMRPGDGADEYRSLIQRMVDTTELLRKADKLLLEMLEKGNPSLSLVEVKPFLEKVGHELLVVAEPVSQVKVHSAIPEHGLLNIKTTADDVLASFLETIERSVNWPLTKRDLAKIADRIRYLIAAIMNKLPLQLYVSPNLKVDRIVAQIAGKLKVLARTILALANQGNDGTIAAADMEEILQQIQELAKTIHADLQNLYSIDVHVIDVDGLSKFSSAPQELSDEVKLVLQQVGGTTLGNLDLHRLIWKVEKLYIHTTQIIYGPISRDSGLMYQDLFERLRIILGRFTKLVPLVDMLGNLISQNDIFQSSSQQTEQVVDLMRKISMIFSDIVVFMGYQDEGVAQQPPLLDLLIMLQNMIIKILTKYSQAPVDYNELELAQSVIILGDFVNSILNGVSSKYLEFLPAVHPEAEDILKNLLQEIDGLQQITYVVVKYAERSTFELNVPGGFQNLETKDLQDAIDSVRRIHELVEKILSVPELNFKQLSEVIFHHKTAILDNAERFLTILKDPREVSALTVAKVIYHVQNYMTAVLEGIYGNAKEDMSCSLTNIIFHYKHFLEVESNILVWIGTGQVSNKEAYNYLRTLQITSRELWICVSSTGPGHRKTLPSVQPDDISQVVLQLIYEIISASKDVGPNGSIDPDLLARFHQAVQLLVTNVLDGFGSEIKVSVLRQLYKELMVLLQEVFQLTKATYDKKLAAILTKVSKWLNQLLEFVKERPNLNIFNNISEEVLQLVENLQEKLSAELIIDESSITELVTSLQKAVIHITILEGIDFPTDILRILEIIQLVKVIMSTTPSPGTISDIIQQLEVLYDIILSLDLAIWTTTSVPHLCDLNNFYEKLRDIALALGELDTVIITGSDSLLQKHQAEEKVTQLLTELSSSILPDLIYCFPELNNKVYGFETIISLVVRLKDLLIEKPSPTLHKVLAELTQIVEDILKLLGSSSPSDASTLSPTTTHVCNLENYYEKVQFFRELTLSVRELIQIIALPSASRLEIDSAKDRLTHLLNKLPSSALSHLVYCYPELKVKMPDIENLLAIIDNLEKVLPLQVDEQLPVLKEILPELEQMVEDILKILGAGPLPDLSTASPTTIHVCDMNNYDETIKTLKDLTLSVRELVQIIAQPSASSLEIDSVKYRVAQLLNELPSTTLAQLLYCYPELKVKLPDIEALLAVIDNLEKVLPLQIDEKSPVLQEILAELEQMVKDILQILGASPPPDLSTASPTTIHVCDLSNYYEKIETLKYLTLSVRELIQITAQPSVSSLEIDSAKDRVTHLLNKLASSTLSHLFYCYPELQVKLPDIEALLAVIDNLEKALPLQIDEKSPVLQEILPELEQMAEDILKILGAGPLPDFSTAFPTTIHVCYMNNYDETIKTLKDLTLSVRELIQIIAQPSASSLEIDSVKYRVAQLLNELPSTTLAHLLYCHPELKVKLPDIEALLAVIDNLEKVLPLEVDEQSPVLQEILQELEQMVKDILQILGAGPPPDLTTTSPTTTHVCDLNNYIENIESLKDLTLSVRVLIQIIAHPSASWLEIDSAKYRVTQLLNELPSTTLAHLLYCYPDLKATLPDIEALPAIIDNLEIVLSVQIDEKSPVLQEILAELEQMVKDILQILGAGPPPDLTTTSPTTTHVCDLNNYYENIESLKDLTLSVRVLIQIIAHPSASWLEIDSAKDRVTQLLNELPSTTLAHLLYCYPELKVKLPDIEALLAVIDNLEKVLPLQIDEKSPVLQEILAELEQMVEDILQILGASPPPDLSTASPTTIHVCDLSNYYEKIETLKYLTLSVRELIQITAQPSVSSLEIDFAKDRVTQLLNELPSTTLAHLLYCYPELKVKLPDIKALLAVIDNLEKVLPLQIDEKSPVLQEILGELEQMVEDTLQILGARPPPDLSTASPTTIHVCDLSNYYEKIETLKYLTLSVRELIQIAAQPSVSSLETDSAKDRVTHLLNKLASSTLSHLFYCYPELKVKLPNLEDLLAIIDNLEKVLSLQIDEQSPVLQEILQELEQMVKDILQILGAGPPPDLSTTSPTTKHVCDLNNYYEMIETLKDLTLSVRELIQIIAQPLASSLEIDSAKDKVTQLLNKLPSSTLSHLLYCYPELKVKLPNFEDLLAIIDNLGKLLPLQVDEESPILRELLPKLEQMVKDILQIFGVSPPLEPSIVSPIRGCDSVDGKIRAIVIQLRQLISQALELNDNLSSGERLQNGQRLKVDLGQYISSLSVIMKCNNVSSVTQTTLEAVLSVCKELFDSLTVTELNPSVAWDGFQIEFTDAHKLLGQLLWILSRTSGTPTTPIPGRGSELWEIKEMLQSVLRIFENLKRPAHAPNSSQDLIPSIILELGSKLRYLVAMIKSLSFDPNLIPIEIRDVTINMLFDFLEMTPILETVLQQLDKTDSIDMLPEGVNDMLDFIFKYLQQLQQLILIALGENPGKPDLNVEKPVKLQRELLLVIVHLEESLKNPSNSSMTKDITQLQAIIQRFVLETSNLPIYPSTQDPATTELILELRSLAHKLKGILSIIGNATAPDKASSQIVVFLNIIMQYSYNILKLQPPHLGQNQKQPEDVLQLLRRINDKLKKVAEGGIPNSEALTALHLIVQQAIALIYTLYDSPIGANEYRLVEQLKTLSPVFEVYLKLSKGCTNGASCRIPDLIDVITILVKQIKELTSGPPNTDSLAVSTITPPNTDVHHVSTVNENVKLYIDQLIEQITKFLNDPANVMANRDLYSLVKKLLKNMNSLPWMYAEGGLDAMSSNILVQTLKGSTTIFEELLNDLECVISHCTNFSQGKLVELLDVILRIIKSLRDVTTAAHPPNLQLKKYVLDIYEVTKMLIDKLNVPDVTYTDIASLVEQLNQNAENYIKLSSSLGDTARYLRRFNAILQFLLEYSQRLPYDLNVESYINILTTIIEFISRVPDLSPSSANPTLSVNLVDLMNQLEPQLKRIVELDTFSSNNVAIIPTLNELTSYVNQYIKIIDQAPDMVPTNQEPKLVELFIETKSLDLALEEVLNIATKLRQQGTVQENVDKLKQLLKIVSLSGKPIVQCIAKECWSQNVNVFEDEGWHGDDPQVIQTIHKNVMDILEALEGLDRELESKRSQDVDLTKFISAVNTYILTQETLPSHLSKERLDVVLTYYKELGPYLETALGLLSRKGEEAHTLLRLFLSFAISHVKQVREDAKLIS